MSKQLALLSIILLFVAGASAQFNISIPSIPKIKKPKTGQEQTNTSQTNNTSNNNTSTQTTSNNDTRSDGCDQYGVVPGVFLDDIKKKQQEAAAYNGPQNKIYYVSETQDDYIKMAVSKQKRDAWFNGKGDFMLKYRADQTCNKIDPALDELAKIAAKTLPLYVPESGKYTVRNAAEEALMKKQITDIATLKIYKIGLDSANWHIETNSLGIPIDRYKYGIIYGRQTAVDDPWCRMVFVNVVQQYAGGGTYGATYGNFIKSEVAGCPAN